MGEEDDEEVGSKGGGDVMDATLNRFARDAGMKVKS